MFCLLGIAALIILSLGAACAQAPKVGDVVWSNDFGGPDALKGFPQPAAFGSGFNSAQSLYLERPAGGANGGGW
jgi:hypothetical protein